MFRKNVHFKNSLHNCYFCISTKNHVNPTMPAGHRTRVLGASETQKKIRFGGWCVIEIFAVKLNANELPPLPELRVWRDRWFTARSKYAALHCTGPSISPHLDRPFCVHFANSNSKQFPLEKWCLSASWDQAFTQLMLKWCVCVFLNCKFCQIHSNALYNVCLLFWSWHFIQ